MNIMRDIKFNLKEYENDKYKEVYSHIKVKYNKEDRSLYTINAVGNGMFAIENSDIIINFDLESKRICGISGYIGDLDLIKNIDLPSISTLKSGILCADTNGMFISGVAYEIKFDYKIRFDRKNNYLVIGDFNQKDEIYRTLENVYLQLNEYLNCILIKLN